MPGPKFPQGYPKYFHDIAAKLISDRPEFLEVDVPIQAGYARTTFNYFRQSWLRYYEFMTKARDTSGARVALDTYNKLIAYEVKISPPFTLIFNSKDRHLDIVMREGGPVQTPLKEWLPIQEDIKGMKKGSQQTGPMRVKDPTNLPTKAEADAGIRRQQSVIEDVFGLKKKEQIIPDNPPQIPTENKYGLPIGPPPGFFDEKTK